MVLRLNGTVPQPTSALIAVMGCSGAGKTSFINLLTGRTNAQAGHSFSATTSEIEACIINVGGFRITIVDTPGFSDTEASDQTTVIKLLKWLGGSYYANQRLNGILYLHRIDAHCEQGSALRNLVLFKKLCGEGFCRNIILGSTGWNLLEAPTVGIEREKELVGADGLWHPLRCRGTDMVRVFGTRESALHIVMRLASRNAGILKCQHELGRIENWVEFLSAASMVEQEHSRALREISLRTRREIEEDESTTRMREEELARKHQELELQRLERGRQLMRWVQIQGGIQREREFKASQANILVIGLEAEQRTKDHDVRSTGWDSVTTEDKGDECSVCQCNDLEDVDGEDEEDESSVCQCHHLEEIDEEDEEDEASMSQGHHLEEVDELDKEDENAICQDHPLGEGNDGAKEPELSVIW